MMTEVLHVGLVSGELVAGVIVVIGVLDLRGEELEEHQGRDAAGFQRSTCTGAGGAGRERSVVQDGAWLHRPRPLKRGEAGMWVPVRQPLPQRYAHSTPLAVAVACVAAVAVCVLCFRRLTLLC